MEHIQSGLKLWWLREDPEAPLDDPAEKLCLRVDVAEGESWAPLGTGQPMLSMFPAAAPEAMREAALEVFADLLSEAKPDAREGLLTHLLWYELTDRDVLARALARVRPSDLTAFLFGLAQLEPRSAQRAVTMASDEQLAALTADDAVALAQHPNPEARAPLLLSLRENSRRLTGLRR